MRTTVQYLDAVKKRLDLPSDYAAAKALGVTRSAVSLYRNGKSVFDEATAARAADILGLDPLEVISACKAESAPDAFMRKVWENAWGKATGVASTTALAVVVSAGLLATPSPARSAPISADNVISLSYVKSRKRYGKTTLWDSRAAA
jgi:transcriptional regulator with XRE-family HTH domain